MKLYELPRHYEEIYETLSQNGGEVTEELELCLAALNDELETKVQNLALLIRQSEARADAIDAEAKRLQALSTVERNTAKRLKEYLHRNLVETKVDQVKTDLCLVWVQNSPPKVEFLGEDVRDLPVEYTRVIPEERVLDTKAVLAAAKAGEELPETLAVTQGTHLRMK